MFPPPGGEAVNLDLYLLGERHGFGHLLGLKRRRENEPLLELKRGLGLRTPLEREETVCLTSSWSCRVDVGLAPPGAGRDA